MQLCKNARHCTSLVVRYWCPVRILDLRALAIPLGPNLTTVDIGHSTIEARCTTPCWRPPSCSALANPGPAHPAYAVQDHQLAILSTHLSSIRVLVLSDCHAISSKGIRPLVRQPPSLPPTDRTSSSRQQPLTDSRRPPPAGASLPRDAHVADALPVPPHQLGRAAVDRRHAGSWRLRTAPAAAARPHGL